MDVNEVIGACTSLTVVSLSVASVLIAKRRRKRQHSAWVKQYIRQRAKFGALTTLLPELADNEVTMCFQYLRMNKDTFQELLALVEPLIARRITKFRFCTVIS